METRLRRKFKYPEEDDEPEAMDEEEQEQFITKLQKENSDRNKDWIRLFLYLVLASAALFLPGLLASSGANPRYTALMGISSLLATAYNLVLIPNTQGGSDPLAQLAASRDIELSPLQKWLPYLNAPLALLIGVSGSRWRSSAAVHEGFYFVCWVPLLMYAFILVVKRSLVKVDPAELEKARYEWKGA